MSLRIRRITAIALFGLSSLAAVPAHADGIGAGGITISGGVTVASDYRFRGVSQTGGDPAVQGTVTISHDSGIYAGAWASNVDFKKFGGDKDERYGDAELNIYGGWTGDLGPWLTGDVGLIYYVYPDGAFANPERFEPYASLSTTVGPAKLKLGANYAWEQSSLGGDDNLYVYSKADVGIPATPLTVSAHLGYTDGALAPSWIAGTSDRSGFDYSLGLSGTVMRKFTLGLSYVGSEGPNVDDLTDDAVVGTLSFNF